jgi:hypothetical protein
MVDPRTHVRSALRKGLVPARATSIDPVQALLAALPEAMRAAVRATIEGKTATAESSRVGTAVGTNENGPGKPGP